MLNNISQTLPLCLLWWSFSSSLIFTHTQTTPTRPHTHTHTHTLTNSCTVGSFLQLTEQHHPRDMQTYFHWEKKTHKLSTYGDTTGERTPHSQTHHTTSTMQMPFIVWGLMHHGTWPHVHTSNHSACWTLTLNLDWNHYCTTQKHLHIQVLQSQTYIFKCLNHRNNKIEKNKYINQLSF